MSFELANFRGKRRSFTFDSLRCALEKAERSALSAFAIWEIDSRGKRFLRLQVGSSSTT